MAAAAATTTESVNLDDLSDLAWPELPAESQQSQGSAGDILDPANLWPLDGQVAAIHSNIREYILLLFLFSSKCDVSMEICMTHSV